ncbi:pentatricopeptide repeat-containing protein At5g66520-like [Asparagus officinalis]|uniref:pentatricopeptide repeat-containing protein At5g66520-like n=1 Tax=Asparagus officinalis TaxID=4686 RepID=UPI00098E4EB9|nr:pentatricopeptide repeat-containing protein At5g66520-like [Asparagus officinalis]
MHYHCSSPEMRAPLSTVISRQNSSSKLLQSFSFSTSSNIKTLKQTHANLIRTQGIHNPLLIGKLIADIATSHPSNLPYARSVFSQVQTQPNTFTWNSLIRGYAHCQNPTEAIALFRLMLCNGVSPNNYTYPFALKASASLPDPCVGLSLHGSLIRRGFEDFDEYIQTSLINFYASCGSVDVACKLFDKCPVRDVTTWNALIKGYIECERYNDAIRVFRVMQDRSKVKGDEITMLAVVSACAHLGALEVGRWMHAYIDRNRMRTSLNLATALVNMYVKCGEIEIASSLFRGMKERDVRVWSVMISGLAIHGLGKEALGLFYEMQSIGINPDSVTLTAVLSACSHSGLVNEGLKLLDRMQIDYLVEPTIEHYGCIVDLLGRAGRLKEALGLIQRIPLKPDVALWGALLVACRVHKDVDMGEKVAKEMLELDPHHAGAHVFLSNVYASYKKWELVEEVRNSMKDQKIRKPPGSSLIELDGVVHEFVSGDSSHPDSQKIYLMLDEFRRIRRMKEHQPFSGQMLFDIEEEEDKEVCLSQHSEKLAVAFGLIKTKPGSQLRIVKNLRICEDCHSLMKMVSEFFKRDVIVRDRSRFHHFRNGDCSCKEYW